jgi:hypothetical protein
MSDFEPIPVKMKMADPEQVTATMVEVVRTSPYFAGAGPFAANLVRDIQTALAQKAIVMIQPDVPSSGHGEEGKEA